MTTIQLYIDVSQTLPVAEGGNRKVYQHPEREDLLVKILRSRIDAPATPLPKGMGWRRFKLNRTYGDYVSYAREINEFIRARRNSETYRPPFARVFGLIDTSLGLGIVVEKIMARDGSLAPTLERLIKDRLFTDEIRLKLDAFFQQCEQDHVVLNELHLANLVYCADDGGRFICIDGIGEKAAIPIHVWSRSLNARKLKRWRQRLDNGIKALEAQTSLVQ